jgi:hypothetical protein
MKGCPNRLPARLLFKNNNLDFFILCPIDNKMPCYYITETQPQRALPRTALRRHSWAVTYRKYIVKDGLGKMVLLSSGVYQDR